MTKNHVTKFRNGRSLRQTASELDISHDHVRKLEIGEATPTAEWLFLKASTAESEEVRNFAAAWLAELYPELADKLVAV